MSHTPGPWGYVYDGSSVWSVGREEYPQDARIASVQKCSRGEDGWHEAASNAALIAAAPELLDALKSFCGDMESLGGSPALGLRTAYEHALSVIAKAEGR